MYMPSTYQIVPVLHKTKSRYEMYSSPQYVKSSLSFKTHSTQLFTTTLVSEKKKDYCVYTHLCQLITHIILSFYWIWFLIQQQKRKSNEWVPQWLGLVDLPFDLLITKGSGGNLGLHLIFVPWLGIELLERWMPSHLVLKASIFQLCTSFMDYFS